MDSDGYDSDFFELEMLSEEDELALQRSMLMEQDKQYYREEVEIMKRRRELRIEMEQKERKSEQLRMIRRDRLHRKFMAASSKQCS